MQERAGKWKIGSDRGQIIKILGIVFLVLLLQIPIFKIDSLVQERRVTRNHAVAEVTQKWGKRQVLQGPLIIVPYLESVKKKEGSPWVVEQKTLYATFLPEHLSAEANINSELRYRSIYGIPLYRAQVSLKGDFDLKKMVAASDDRDLQWDKARLVIAMTDPKSVTAESSLMINGKEVALEPGSGQGVQCQSGFHAPLNIGDSFEQTRFELSLQLGGSDGFFIAPVGRHSSIKMASDWKDPSFQGNWLPSKRTVNEQGFTAAWEIPYLGRNYPQSWFGDGGNNQMNMAGSAIGVDLAFPLDTYGKTERSIKYELIFIGLTFVGFWLFEILSGIRIHPMQYLLVGGAVCLFYLLLLSLAEHIGFLGAYFIAASMVVSLVSAYAKIMLQSRGRAALVGAGMTALYLYLLALLQEQEYSLLAGSIGMFVILAAVMFLTRNVNWYSASKEAQVATED
jgi:inner membrane protein